VSWQIASYAILGLVLLGGFTWYERSRPPSQIVALVAALAALAVAGRVAFPVIPNLVATTDVVFFCGYAIGAAPGFMVGALAGVVSNFWLGQGPWTPWQMGAWGLCGLAGAGVAVLSRRRLNRYGLAAVCGLLGLFYGALLDFSLMVTYGGEQSLDRFLAISARSIPFNVVHATGNVAIALAAGPAMVRMLVRFRERFEVTYRPKPSRPQPVLPVALAAIAALSLGGLSAGGGQASAAASTTSWMRAAQNADGGFGIAPGSESNAGMTGWASLGLEAAGVNPLDVAKGGETPISYLRANPSEVRTVGDLERSVLVLRGAGLGARAFGGRDLVAELRRARGGDGSYDGAVNLTAFGILAMKAAGAGGNAKSAAWLRAAQNTDGGWGLAPKTGSDADSTGAALQALAVAGGGPALAKGVDYLRAGQHKGGGFALAFNGPVNSQSTAWAVQGLLAAGVNPGSLRRGGTPLSYLAKVRAVDGHYRYSSSSDQTPVWVTGQVLTAVDGKPYPIAAVPRAPAPSSGGSAATPAPTGGTFPGKAAAPGAVSPAPTGGSQAPAPSTANGLTGSTPSADSKARDDDSGPSAVLITAGGIAAACALAAGGWFLYRRRLA
jgi:energy-coupling factor transport system substrate-specific component